MQHNSTVVTFFFDLTKLEDSKPNTRSIDFYLKNGKSTLMIDRPMVIFCDSIHKSKIMAIREEVCPNVPTVYIEKCINEYDHYKLNWPLLDPNRPKEGSRVTRSYFLTVTFKFVALLIAAQRNDFLTSHYTWIDFGCSYVAPTDFVISARELLDKPRPAISVCYIRHRTTDSLKDSSLYCSKGSCGVATGIMSVERNYVFKLYARFMRVFYEQLEKNIWHADEQILMYVFNRHPELFNVYYGDYRSLLTNYHDIRLDWHHIRWFFINEAVKVNDYKSAKIVLDKLLYSVNSGRVTDISDSDKEALNVLNEEITNKCI